MEIDIYTAILMLVAGIAIGVFIYAYWRFPKFRIVVNCYIRKAYREYKEEIFEYIDVHITDIVDETKVYVSAKTHKYIKNEVLRQAIEAKLMEGIDFGDEWVKMKYKEVLEDLMRNR